MKSGQIELSGEIKRKIGVYEKTGAFKLYSGGTWMVPAPKKCKRITGKYLRLQENKRALGPMFFRT